MQHIFARIACELMDELVDAFEAKAIHIGCDEVFEIGFGEIDAL